MEKKKIGWWKRNLAESDWGFDRMSEENKSKEWGEIKNFVHRNLQRESLWPFELQSKQGIRIGDQGDEKQRNAHTRF